MFVHSVTADVEDRTKPTAGDLNMSSSIESSSTKPRELAAWILMVVFAVMLFVSVMGNILVLWVYKKRQAGDDCSVPPSKYEMEGNPCYEATAVKQTTDTETHVYEAVKGGGAKYM